MATGERRLGSSARRGMTVLGKIPAVPKPINLPSQRLENRGLDPSVEIVPRGTFSWGTGRSPPANSSSLGNVGLSSSPPINTGAWNTASINTQPVSSSDNVSGGVAQNPPRPLSAGSTRPLSAGTTRPSSASATSGRAWVGASKLDEQLQPSCFNLATVDFPTLGSEKNPNLRPQQNMAPSSRPTSADATKERNLVHTGTSLNRPTSADGSKERKLIYPDVTLPSFPPFVDGNLSEQRHPIYIGVVGHGTAGPGPGTHSQYKDGYNIYPPLVQHGIALPGSHMLHSGDIMHPGLAQNDRYFNGPRISRSNIERDVLVLPVDSRPGMHANYPFDFRSNHFDMSRVHQPPSSWGPSHSDRSGVYQSHRPPHGIMQIEPPPYGMETVMQRQQGNRRDGLNASHKSFGEQRAGWDGGNVVYIGSSIDIHDPSVPTSGSGRELQSPDVCTTSWGHEPKNSGWGNSYSGDTAAEIRSGGASSGMYEQTALLPGGPEDKHKEVKGAGHTGEILPPVSIKGSDVGKPGGRQNVQSYKQEETVKSLTGETMNAGPEFLKKENDTRVNGNPLSGSGPSAEIQPLKMKHADERNRFNQVREPERLGLVSTMTNQTQEDNGYGKLQTKDSTHIVNMGSPKGPEDVFKNTNLRKDTPLSQRVTKENKKEDLHSSRTHESDESGCASKTRPSKVLDVNDSTSSIALLSTPGKECNNDVSSGVQVSSNATKEARSDPGSNGAVGAVQARSSTHVVSQDASAGDHKAMPTGKSTFPVAPVVETVAAPSSEEDGQALNDDLNTRTKRNIHSSRRPHPGRSVHESHLMDKQHANHGMVWTPVKTPTAGTTKDENQPNTEKAGKVREPIQHTSTEINHDKPIQPLQKYQPSESRSQRHAQQVQQMQSAASSQQAQGQQMQERTVVSKMHHQKVEMSSKQQGQRMQQQSRASNNKESDYSMQQEQFTTRSCKNQTLETKQSVASSHPEQERQRSQFAAISQGEVNKEEILSANEQQDKIGESRWSPGVDKLDGKKNKSENTIYVPRPVRNQQRQGREQEHDQRFAASNQRFLKKEERLVVEDQENLPSETSTLPVAQSSKNNDEVKSHHPRYSKQQKRRQHESSASLNAGERHASTWNKPLLEEQGEQSVNSHIPSCVAQPEDKEESKTPTGKLVRHQELQNKQSATVNHQEHIRITGGHKKASVETPESNSHESSATKNEMTLYIPKHRKQKTHQQESAAGYEGLKSQERTSEEVHLLNEKDKQYTQSPHLSGVGSNVVKDGIELYTSKPARQPHMQGHPSTVRGHRRQRIVDLAEGQAVRSPSSHATVESPLSKDKEITRHDGVSDVMELTDASGAAGNRDETKLHAVFESSQGKKEGKLYVAKPARQPQLHQQSVANVDQGHVEVPSREGLLQEMSHQMPANESSKRKEEIKRYTPKPARQQTLTEPSVILDMKPVKQTGDLPLSEENEQQRRVNHGRANDIEHVYKSRNHLTRLHKSAPFSRPQMEIEPELEDGTVNDHLSRVDETNGAAIVKEHAKDRESGFYQKRGSRQRNHDVAESPNMEEVEIVRPKQYQKQHYQYQPVAQQQRSVKPREEDANAVYEHKLNPRQKDYGQNRYCEAPPRRGQHHGYGYGYRATDHAG